MFSRPYEANRSLAVLSRLFNWARECGREIANPCTNIKSHPEKKRGRYATAIELKKLGHILERDKETHTQQTAFILLLLYTGARPSEVHKMTTHNLDGNIIQFKGKTGWAEVILPRKVAGLLPSQPFVMNWAKRYWNKVRIEIGAPDLRMRDLRRTFATIALSSGESIDKVGELLNHKSAETTKIYAKLLGTEKTEVVNRVATSIEELLQ